MRKKVLVTESIDDKGIQLLKDHGCEIIIGSSTDKESLIKEGYDCDGILTRNAIINEDVINAGPKLRVMSIHGVG